jgi:dTDP-4-amino-4,6-dideoxygalactose transaminase
MVVGLILAMIVPNYTFFATATPLFILGAIPVLVDCQLKDGNIDPIKIEAAITSKTKAVIITHMWGIPCDMEEISLICKKHNILLLEDCSHAHGALYDDAVVGTGGIGNRSGYCQSCI